MEVKGGRSTPDPEMTTANPSGVWLPLRPVDCSLGKSPKRSDVTLVLAFVSLQVINRSGSKARRGPLNSDAEERMSATRGLPRRCVDEIPEGALDRSHVQLFLLTVRLEHALCFTTLPI